MPLIEFYKNSRDAFEDMTIKQIVSSAGNGQLKDGNDTQSELREYFTLIEVEKLETYAQECLDNPFDKSGLVLQDLINEIGKRLGFDVENGLYQGVRNDIGFDGIWKINEQQDNYQFVIEAKTTANFPIDLERVDSYRKKLIQANKITENSSTLFIVGRNNTLNLEQQIRGSKFAWYMRILGLESLIKLMHIHVESSSDEVTYKIREVLKPVEYTRVDGIVDIIFTASSDKEISDDNSNNTDSPINTEEDTPSTHDDNRMSAADKRKKIAQKFAEKHNTQLIKRKQALFSDNHDNLRAAISISKRYDKSHKYWYSYHSSVQRFLVGASGNAFMIYGCLDKDYAFALPVDIIENYKPKLNSTPATINRSEYWHIFLLEQNNTMKFVLKTGEEIDLAPYKFDL